MKKKNKKQIVTLTIAGILLLTGLSTLSIAEKEVNDNTIYESSTGNQTDSNNPPILTHFQIVLKWRTLHGCWVKLFFMGSDPDYDRLRYQYRINGGNWTKASPLLSYPEAVIWVDTVYLGYGGFYYIDGRVVDEHDVASNTLTQTVKFFRFLPTYQPVYVRVLPR